MVRHARTDGAPLPHGGIGQRTLIAIVVVAFIGAGVTLIVAGVDVAVVIGFLTAILALVVPLVSVNGQAQEIHRVANATLTRSQERTEQLSQSMQDAGVPLPPDTAVTGLHDPSDSPPV